MPQSVPEGRRELMRVARGATPAHEHLRARIIFLFVLAGSFGAFFHRRGLERDPLTSAFASAAQHHSSRPPG